MAKIAPKGKKVVGTKKKDKITWASTKPWKKALTVKAGAGNDVINFKKSKYKNKIYGEAGKDKIYGGKGADKIYGGKGNDTINAGKGKNTLYFSKGDGTDTVLKGGGTDTLVFKTEKSLTGLKVAYSGNNAIITYNGGSVVLKDYKLGGHSAKYVQVGSTKKAIADFFKPTGTTYNIINGGSNHNIVGTDGHDSITATAQDDTITGGKGNDIIKGGAGANTYIYNNGDGVDTITTTSDTDIIKFNDYTSTDIDFRASGTDLYITHSGNDIINLKNFLNPDNITNLKLQYSDDATEYVFSRINDRFNVYYANGGNFGGAALNASDMDDIIIATKDINYYAPFNEIIPNKGNDRLYSYDIVTQYTINADDGNDILYQRGGESRFVFNNATVDELIADGAWQKNGSDLLIKYDGTNVLTIKDYYTANNKTFRLKDSTSNWYEFEDCFAKTIKGSENNDTALGGTDEDEIIRGFEGDDVITGGKGNDVLIGGVGNNTYVFNKGDGNDKITYTSGSKDLIKFNDVDVTELKFGYTNNIFTIKYGENDSIRLSGGTDGDYKIQDKNNTIYNFIYDDTRSLSAASDGIRNYNGRIIVDFNTDGNNVLIVSGTLAGTTSSLSSYNIDCNYVISSREDYNKQQYSASYILKSPSQGTFLVDGNYSNATITTDANSTIKFTDTTLDEVSLSLVPKYSNQPYGFNDYNFGLSYNSGKSYISLCNNDIYHNFSNVLLKDYTGASTTLFEKLRLQKLINSSSDTGTVFVNSAEKAIATGTANDDLLMSSLRNSEYQTTAYGKGGNDTIWGFYTAYSYDVGTKNPNSGDVAKIYAAEWHSSTIYAQSETNEIIGSAYQNDTYYAYIDQKTSIFEVGQTSSSINDVLNLVNTSDSDKDGQLFDSSDNSQIHVLFNVSSDYNKDNDGLYVFGDVSFVDNDNLALWSLGQNYKGITVTNNGIETINTTDGYLLTNADIADLAHSVAGWLTSGGRNYGSVNDVLASNNETDITALIAQFDNANWQSSI